MQSLLDFSFTSPEYFPLYDRGETWVFQVLTALRPKPRRIIAIGGSRLLFTNLLKANFEVCHIDASGLALGQMVNKIKNIYPKGLGRFSSYQFKLNQNLDLRPIVLDEEDCFLFLRSLHHLENATEILKVAVARAAEGSFTVILDMSVELMELRRIRFQNERTDILRQINGDASAIMQYTKAWQESDIVDLQCFAGFYKMGLLNEWCVRRFLANAGVRPLNFWYAPSCPCPDPICPEMTMYWFTAWQKIHGIEKNKI